MKIQITLTLLFSLILQLIYAQVTITDADVTQSENSIFIDRTNPLGNPSSFTIINANNGSNWIQDSKNCNYVITWSGIHYYYNNLATSTQGSSLIASYDGGGNWSFSNSILYGLNGDLCDPSVCMDLNNNWYYAYLVLTDGTSSVLGGTESNTNVVVAHSYNYGNSFTPELVGSSGLEDKPDLWVDNKRHTSNGGNNNFQGNVYVGWTDYKQNLGGTINFAYSTDQGRSWNTPTTGAVISNGVPNTLGNQGINIKTGPNGEVYACWATNELGSENQIAWAASYDGGQTFNSAVIARSIEGISSENFTAGWGQGAITMRKNSLPVMAVNQLNGDIYIVWPDKNDGSGFRVKMIVSTDGSTFNTPVGVGGIMARNYVDMWSPWITCDETSGAIAVIYYATVASSLPNAYTWVSYSYDEGQTWTDRQLTGSPWDGEPIPNNGILAAGYAGDYLGIDMFAGWVVPGWLDDQTNGGSHTFGDCQPNSNMLPYTNPFSIRCNPDPWVLCSKLNSSLNPYNISDYAFFQSQQSLTAGGTGCLDFTVQPSGYCTMQASTGNAIYLEPGFTAKSGSYFHASISDGSNCTELTTLPSISASNICLCGSGSTTLTELPISGFSYTWAPSTGLNTTTGTSVTATPSQTTTYTVTGTDGTNTLSTFITVYVGPGLPVITDDENTLFCVDDDIGIWANSPCATSYNWQLNESHSGDFNLTYTGTGPYNYNDLSANVYSTSVTVKVQGVNSCGAGPWASFHTSSSSSSDCNGTQHKAETRDSVSQVKLTSKEINVNEYKVYPNPANTLLNIKIKIEGGQVAYFVMYNEIGEEVQNLELHSKLTTMPLSNLQAGIYYYRITDKNQNLLKADKQLIIH